MKVPAWFGRRARNAAIRKTIEQDKEDIAAAKEILEEARRRTDAALSNMETKGELARVELQLLEDLRRGFHGS